MVSDGHHPEANEFQHGEAWMILSSSFLPPLDHQGVPWKMEKWLKADSIVAAATLYCSSFFQVCLVPVPQHG